MFALKPIGLQRHFENLAYTSRVTYQLNCSIGLQSVQVFYYNEKTMNVV